MIVCRYNYLVANLLLYGYRDPVQRAPLLSLLQFLDLSFTVGHEDRHTVQITVYFKCLLGNMINIIDHV